MRKIDWEGKVGYIEDVSLFYYAFAVYEAKRKSRGCEQEEAGKGAREG